MTDTLDGADGRDDEELQVSPPKESSTAGIPNPETGVGIGAGAASTFEPEEDAPAEDPRDV